MTSVDGRRRGRDGLVSDLSPTSDHARHGGAGAGPTARRDSSPTGVTDRSPDGRDAGQGPVAQGPRGPSRLPYGGGVAAHPNHHLAQLNVSLPLEPLTSARLAGFVELLEPVNALADAAPGFVWRLQTEDGDATAVRALDDDQLIINLTVWESVEALATFVYGEFHASVMRRRREWFHRLGEVSTVLWWVPAGVRPTVADAEDRLRTLRVHGPTPSAFTVRHGFPPPGSSDAQVADDDWFCPA